MLGSSALMASTRSWYFFRVFSDASCLKILLKNALALTTRARPAPRRDRGAAAAAESGVAVEDRAPSAFRPTARAPCIPLMRGTADRIFEAVEGAMDAPLLSSIVACCLCVVRFSLGCVSVSVSLSLCCCCALDRTMHALSHTYVLDRLERSRVSGYVLRERSHIALTARS